jgi:hypothetical protein
MATTTNPSMNTGGAAKCANPQCNCKARAGDTHCSDACKTAGATESCNCGHPECASGAMR